MKCQFKKYMIQKILNQENPPSLESLVAKVRGIPSNGKSTPSSCDSSSWSHVSKASKSRGIEHINVVFKLLKLMLGSSPSSAGEILNWFTCFGKKMIVKKFLLVYISKLRFNRTRKLKNATLFL